MIYISFLSAIILPTLAEKISKEDKFILSNYGEYLSLKISKKIIKDPFSF